MPINYRAGDSSWQPIDNTIVKSSVAGFAYENKANSYRALIPSDLSSPLRYEMGKEWVSFSLVGAKGPASVSGPTATFAQALPGVNVSYTALNDTLRESISLSSLDATPSSLVFQLKSSPGLTTQPDGTYLNFITSSGNVIFSFDPAYMFDANPENSAYSSDVSSIIATDKADGSVSSLTLTPDPKWLQDPARVWPVTIDPSVSLGASQDCKIDQSAPTTSYCTDNTIRVGVKNSNAQRSLLTFDTSGIPYDATVLNSDLALYATNETNSTPIDIQIQRLTQSWNNSATWNKHNATANWAASGGDFASTVEDRQNSIGGTINTTYHWYPTSLVQSWVDGSQVNNGLIMKEPNEGTANVVWFASTDSGANVPTLTVTYQHWMGDMSFQQKETYNLTDRIQANVNLGNGNLMIRQEDLRISGTDGLDLVVDRFYNSYASLVSGQSGWTLSVGGDVHLQVFGNNDVAYYEPGGEVQLFSWTGTDFTTPPGIDAGLTKNGDGTYSLKWRKSQEEYKFDSTTAHPLISDTDGHGNQITFSYDSGLVDDITDTHGRIVDVDYNGSGQVSQLNENNGPTTRTWVYHYTGSLMTSYTDPLSGETDYGYTSNQLTSITDPGNNIGENVTQFGYTSNQVTSFEPIDPTTGSGPSTGYAYTPGDDCSGTPPNIVGNTVETLPNSFSSTTKYCWNKLGEVKRAIDDDGNNQDHTYTANGDVATYTDGTGQTYTTNFYGTTTKVKDINLPTGASQQFHYPSSGSDKYLPDTSTDPQNNTSTYSYDGKGAITQVVDPLTNHNTWIYGRNSNGDGTLTSITDPYSNVTTYAYYTSGVNKTDLHTIDYPSPLGTTTLSYDGLSRLTSVFDGNGVTTAFTYDALDRPTTIKINGTTVITYHYWADDSLKDRVDNTGTTSYSYDYRHLLHIKTLPSSATITTTYDPVGNLASLTDGGGEVDYYYDNLEELDHLTEPGSNTTNFTYNTAHNLSTTTYPNGVKITRSYDHSQRLKEISSAVGMNPALTDFTYVYTLAGADTGVIQNVTDVGNNKTTYTYDQLNRLNEALTKNGTTTISDYSYLYDGNGNMTQKTVGSTSTYYTYNSANELCRSASTSSSTCPTPATFIYDANGNMKADGSGTAFTYNTENQTSSITPSGGSALNMTYTDYSQTDRTAAGGDSFDYSELGLSSKTASSSTTYYTRTNTGQLIDERIPAGGGSFARHYYLFGTNDSVAGLTSSGGSLEGTYSYDPYGGRLSAGSEPSTTNPWRFDSQYWDSQTSLYKMGARYYDPGIARWTQEDPKTGSLTNCSSLNRYSYAGNDPINHADPSGTVCVAGIFGTALAVGTIEGISLSGELLLAGAIDPVVAIIYSSVLAIGVVANIFGSC
jgi:RHS repeat-associated protein